MDPLQPPWRTGAVLPEPGFSDPQHASPAAVILAATATSLDAVYAGEMTPPVAAAKSVPWNFSSVWGPQRYGKHITVIQLAWGGTGMDHNALATQLRRFILSLSLLTEAECVGKPFGEGIGLEGAMSLLPQSFDSIETMRRAGEMMAITLLGATGEGRITPDDVNYVMGVSNIRDGGLTPDQAAAADALAGAAYTFLGQLDEPDGDTWQLWRKRDDVAGEFLCWHAVAWGRLAALGRVDPVRDSNGTDGTERVHTADEDEEISRPTGSAGPSVSQILAEWRPAAPQADRARWREGMTRYDDAPLTNRAEMRASAELMCSALPHYLRGTDITAGTQGMSGELVQTIWNVLVASLLGNDKTTWDAQVERHMRLALAAARHGGLQPESLGGRGTFNQIFDDKGNQILMLAALWELSTSGPKAFTLQDWFASASEDRPWKVP